MSGLEARLVVRRTSRVSRSLAAGLLLLGLLAAACSSPEAVRARGAGPGADIGNHGRPVELHATAPEGGMFYQTPKEGLAIRK